MRKTKQRKQWRKTCCYLAFTEKKKVKKKGERGVREREERNRTVFQDQTLIRLKPSVTPRVHQFAGLIDTKLFLCPKSPKDQCHGNPSCQFCGCFPEQNLFKCQCSFVLCSLCNESIICLVKDPVKYVIRLSHHLSLL